MFFPVSFDGSQECAEFGLGDFGHDIAIAVDVCGAVGSVVGQLAKALGVEPEHFREYRLRVITRKLEAMPDLIDRLYKRLG